MRYRGTGGEIASIMSASLYKKLGADVSGQRARTVRGVNLVGSNSGRRLSFDIVKDQYGSLYLLNS